MAGVGKDRTHSIITAIESVAEYILIAAVLIVLMIASYAMWDVHETGSKAQPTEYEKYDPRKNRESFRELVAINSEVFGWINIYGTNIDYPLLQGADNEKYVMTNARGEYSASGSIFLDSRNKKDFSDFNNIIYGHSMSYNAMFGDICDYSDARFYRDHRYGDLYFGGKHHGLLAIGFVKTDAYTSGLLRPLVASETEKATFFNELDANSLYKIKDKYKDINNHYVMLTTCTPGITNGRDILICIITDKVYKDPYGGERVTEDTVDGPRVRIRFFLILLLILAIMICLRI